MLTKMGNPVLHRKVFVIDSADMVALGAALTGNILLMTLKNGDKIIGTSVCPKVQTAGTSWSALTCSVGDAGSATRYSAAVDVFAAPADTTFTDAAKYSRRYRKADTEVRAYLTATGGNLNVCSAGEIEITIDYINELGPGIHE